MAYPLPLSNAHLSGPSSRHKPAAINIELSRSAAIVAGSFSSVQIMPRRRIQPSDFKQIYDIFSAPISRFDCGQYCSPLNGGEPVCCSTENAVPIVDRAEFALLESRSDLWQRYRPKDAGGKDVVRDLHSSCLAVACKGVRHCERDNRSLACRAFPFFPYLDRKRSEE